MCGIFGAINTTRRKVNTDIMGAAAIINRERGKESLGFFDSTGKVYKSAKDPADVLTTDQCTKYLDYVERQSWFCVGHTRFSTRGRVCDENSHPFSYGSVIGAHNGIVDAPHGYDVDSEFLVDLIDNNNNDYQSAFADERGYWTFAWYDKDTEELYLTLHDNTCGLVEYRGAWYFSSDPDHLMTVVGSRECYVFEEGDTIKFTADGSHEWLEKFSANTEKYKRNARTSGGGSDYGFYGNSYSSTTPTGTSTVKVSDPSGLEAEYDGDFQEIWAEYVAKHEA